MTSPSTTTPPVLREIADGVYAYVQPPGGWCLNNAGVITADGHCLLVDTVATEARARRLRAEVERVAPGGPEAVVNTHFHGDHVFGNSQFAPGATIIAHEETRSDMAEAGLGLCHLWPEVDWGDIPLTLPDTTFQDTLTLHVGNLRVELISLGPAHTPGDVAVWVPERRVLFTGDVAWSGVTPYVLMGSVEGSLGALARLRALEPRTVVAGHGQVGGPEVLDATEAYLLRLRQLAEEGIRSGTSPLEAARRAAPEDLGRLLDPERLVGNLHRAYAELQGLPPGARIDVAMSFKEMVEFHGSQPECHA